MYNYKLTGMMEEEQETRNAEYEYKIGLMDPSREKSLLNNKANKLRKNQQMMRNKSKVAAAS